MNKLKQWVLAATRPLVLTKRPLVLTMGPLVLTMGPLVLTMGPLVLTMVFCCIMMQVSCSSKDETATQDKAYTDVPFVILDTDIGSSTDDLFALEMLYHYDEQQLCQLLGVVVDREGEANADFADVMNTYFGHPDVPIGLVQNGIKNPTVWIDYAKVAYMTEADGTTPMFLRTINQPGMRPDGHQLYRRLLAQQPDHSVSIVTTGFVTSLAQLLQSEADEYSALSGVELVRQKVKCIYLQGGVFGDAEESDFNFAQGITFAQTFFDLWPKDVDMVFSPMEVGQAMEYTPEQVIADVSWTDRHPIKQVYMTCDCDTGQRMWDPMCVIQAVEGDSLFSLSQRGTISITPQAHTIFTPSATGNVRYQLPGNAQWAAMMLEKIRTMNKVRSTM
jgi:inosine-uridine nucleoside N-ribohydrolase